MHPLAIGKIINGLIWVACGSIVLTLRGPLFQNSYVLEWEIIGGAMIAFGAARMVWAVAKGIPTSATIESNP